MRRTSGVGGAGTITPLMVCSNCCTLASTALSDGTSPKTRHVSSSACAQVVTAAPAFYRIADGKFPQPVHLGGRACGWTPDALQAWIKDPQGYVAPWSRV